MTPDWLVSAISQHGAGVVSVAVIIAAFMWQSRITARQAVELLADTRAQNRELLDRVLHGDPLNGSTGLTQVREAVGTLEVKVDAIGEQVETMGRTLPCRQPGFHCPPVKEVQE